MTPLVSVELTGARFRLFAPPLTDDVLGMFAERLRAEPEIAPWWFRLIVLRDSAEVAGSIGFSGRPDADGIVTAGYSVFPEDEGRGYASEATSVQLVSRGKYHVFSTSTVENTW